MILKISSSIILLNFIVLFINGYSIQKKALILDKYDFCEIGPRAPFNLSYMNVRTYKYGSMIDTKFELFRDITAVSAIAKIKRCMYKELLDSCEYFATINIKKLCPYLAQKNSIMTPLFYTFKPPYICPFRKGIYIQENGSFDPNLLNVFPLDNFYWKFEMVVYEAHPEIYLYTMCIEGKVILYRE